MDSNYIVSLHGKQFVTYEGLLAQAHRSGLIAIETNVVQIPDESNGYAAVTKARVHMEGADGKVRTYDGVGDAAPGNVGTAVAPHLLRVAETRAKARALRDATNIGMVAVVELEMDEWPAAHQEPVSLKIAPIAGREEKSVTKRQIARIGAEMSRAGWSEQACREYLDRAFGKRSRLELTTSEASRMIDHLSAQPSKAEAQ